MQTAVELREMFRDALCDRTCAERAIRFFRAGLIPRRRPGCRLSESVGIAIEMRAGGRENWQNVYAAAIPGYRTMDKYERGKGDAGVFAGTQTRPSNADPFRQPESPRSEAPSGFLSERAQKSPATHFHLEETAPVQILAGVYWLSQESRLSARSGMKNNFKSRYDRRSNPRSPRERKAAMATKADLEQVLNGVQEMADDALDPELSREELVMKVKEIYDLASGEEDEDDDADDEDSDD